MNDINYSESQRLILDHLLRSGLNGDEFLLEALLWRGFLAYRDSEGIWLGTGSHPADIDVLKKVEGLCIEDVADGGCRAASVRVPSGNFDEIIRGVIGLPHHRGFSAVGLGAGIAPDWTHYTRMKWGAKKAVCPADSLDAANVNDALDTGIALLVKTMSLIRVATSLSCDGHCKAPAYITFHFPWDSIWAQVVLRKVGIQTLRSSWLWPVEDRDFNLRIAPVGPQASPNWLAMYQDIQLVGRRLLDQSLIEAVGEARLRVLEKFSGAVRVRCSDFLDESVRQIEKLLIDQWLDNNSSAPTTNAYFVSTGALDQTFSPVSARTTDDPLTVRVPLRAP